MGQIQSGEAAALLREKPKKPRSALTATAITRTAPAHMRTRARPALWPVPLSGATLRRMQELANSRTAVRSKRTTSLLYATKGRKHDLICIQRDAHERDWHERCARAAFISTSLALGSVDKGNQTKSEAWRQHGQQLPRNHAHLQRVRPPNHGDNSEPARQNNRAAPTTPPCSIR